ncbi:hypothetical protein HPB51_015642 [Rhipicephalus microplus]|uniref:Uncharacterized protein n=1 Tax=Rhipicephalus microplus TaxID=6941 RepID=A0A9J6DAE3_RHIMP|nr:hypothetical protein HPB51_015642 [Rhipicephalus microplus]
MSRCRVSILLAKAGALLGLSDSVDFGRFTRDDQEGAEIALTQIGPTTESATPGALSPHDADREVPPEVAPTHTATVGESAGNSLPSSEILLQNALSVMQSLASALQNTAHAPVQTVRPRAKVDIPTYMGYHDCHSANEYLDCCSIISRRWDFLTPNFSSAWSRCRSRSKRLDGSN